MGASVLTRCSEVGYGFRVGAATESEMEWQIGVAVTLVGSGDSLSKTLSDLSDGQRASSGGVSSLFV